MGYVNVYIPGTCVSSILGVEPSKTRSNFQSKPGSFGFIYTFYPLKYLNSSKCEKKNTINPQTPTDKREPLTLRYAFGKKKTYTSGQQGCTIQFLATRYTRFRRRGIRVYMRKFKTSTGMYQMMDVYNS